MNWQEGEANFAATNAGCAEYHGAQRASLFHGQPGMSFVHRARGEGVAVVQLHGRLLLGNGHARQVRDASLSAR